MKNKNKLIYHLILITICLCEIEIVINLAQIPFFKMLKPSFKQKINKNYRLKSLLKLYQETNLGIHIYPTSIQQIFYSDLSNLTTSSSTHNKITSYSDITQKVGIEVNEGIYDCFLHFISCSGTGREPFNLKAESNEVKIKRIHIKPNCLNSNEDEDYYCVLVFFENLTVTDETKKVEITFYYNTNIILVNDYYKSYNPYVESILGTKYDLDISIEAEFQFKFPIQVNKEDYILDDSLFAEKNTVRLNKKRIKQFTKFSFEIKGKLDQYLTYDNTSNNSKRQSLYSLKYLLLFTILLISLFIGLLYIFNNEKDFHIQMSLNEEVKFIKSKTETNSFEEGDKDNMIG